MSVGGGAVVVVVDVIVLDADITTLDADITTLDADITTLDADGTTLDADGATLDADGTTPDADGATLDADGIIIVAAGKKGKICFAYFCDLRYIQYYSIHFCFLCAKVSVFDFYLACLNVFVVTNFCQYIFDL